MLTVFKSTSPNSSWQQAVLYRMDLSIGSNIPILGIKVRISFLKTEAVYFLYACLGIKIILKGNSKKSS